MTSCAIVQSCYLPWRGYFDLIRQADIFVFLDGVQYTRQDWRNRNRIKTANGLVWLTVPVHDDQRLTLRISQVKIDHSKPWMKKHLRTIEQAYARAPFQRIVLEKLQAAFENPPDLLFELNRRLTRLIWEMFSQNFDKRFIGDESLHLDETRDRNDRLIDLCKQLKVDRYISGPSAREYLDLDQWKNAGIQVDFIQYNYQPYEQLHGPFVSEVSVVDSLMNLGLGCIRDALKTT